MAEARLVRFRAEWVVELPADPEPGDRVAVPFRELVVRGVAPSFEDMQAALKESRERGVPHRFGHLGHVSAEDLDGADVLARLAPTLVEPGATWRASASLAALGMAKGRHMTGSPWYDVPRLERAAEKLGEALDAFEDWAEGWPSSDSERPGPHGGTKLQGEAELASVEPGGPAHGRTVLRVFLGASDTPSDRKRVIAALEAFCEEAERLYGAAENP